jgi:hypothetical protein
VLRYKYIYLIGLEVAALTIHVNCGIDIYHTFKGGGKMLKPEDVDEMSYLLAKEMSKEGSVLIVKLEDGTNVISYGLTKDDTDVRSTENGLVISQEAIDNLDGLEYLFIPEGSCDDDE